jgi:hypothetical protein
MIRSYHRVGLMVGLVMLTAVGAWTWWLCRDEVVTQGGAYGFSIGMTKAEVLDSIRTQMSHPYLYVSEAPDARPVRDSLRPNGPLAQSNYWQWALGGTPIACHEFVFEAGRLVKITTKKRLLETP